MSEPIKVFPVRWGNPLRNIFDRMTRRISDNLFKEGWRQPDPRDLENELSDEEKGRIEIESHVHPR